MALDITAINNLLREYIVDEKLHVLTRSNDNAVLSRVEVDDEYGGKTFDIVVEFGQSGGVGPTFATADANSSIEATFERFECEPYPIYSIKKIDKAAVDRAGDDKKAVEAIMKTALRQCVDGLKREVEIVLHGHGYGDRGRVKTSSGISSLVVTLNEGGMAKYFFKNQRLKAAATLTGALRAPVYTVTAVDVSANTITLDAVTDLADGDYLFAEGGRGSGSNPTRLLPVGLRGWRENSGTLYGVDCSADSQLRVVKRSAGSDTADKALIKAATAMMNISGKKATAALVSANTFGSLSTTLHALWHSNSGEVKDLKIGAASISVVTPGGTIEIAVDHYCLDTEMWVFDEDVLKLGSAGGELFRSNLKDGAIVIDNPSSPQLLMQFVSHIAFGLAHPAAVVAVTGGNWT